MGERGGGGGGGAAFLASIDERKGGGVGGVKGGVVVCNMSRALCSETPPLAAIEAHEVVLPVSATLSTACFPGGLEYKLPASVDGSDVGVGEGERGWERRVRGWCG